MKRQGTDKFFHFIGLQLWERQLRYPLYNANRHITRFGFKVLRSGHKIVVGGTDATCRRSYSDDIAQINTASPHILQMIGLEANKVLTSMRRVRSDRWTLTVSL